MSVHFHFARRSFLSADRCARVRRAMDAGVPEAAATLGSDEGRQAELLEVDSYTLQEVESLFEQLRAELEAFFACRLDEREGPGFVRYRRGDFYGRHRDCGDSPAWPGLARRAVSVVLFLTSSEGGALRLYGIDRQIDIVPEPGLLVAFRSELLHEVRQVTGGERDVVVDWFYGPTGKGAPDRQAPAPRTDER